MERFRRRAGGEEFIDEAAADGEPDAAGKMMVTISVNCSWKYQISNGKGKYTCWLL